MYEIKTKWHDAKAVKPTHNGYYLVMVCTIMKMLRWKDDHWLDMLHNGDDIIVDSNVHYWCEPNEELNELRYKDLNDYIERSLNNGNN